MPLSMRVNASLILASNFRSRSRIRRSKVRSDSRLARSVGSGHASSGLLFIVPSARSASVRISCLRLSRRRRKEFKSLCLIYSGLFGHPKIRGFDSSNGLLLSKAEGHEDSLSRRLLGLERRYVGGRTAGHRRRLRGAQARGCATRNGGLPALDPA